MVLAKEAIEGRTACQMDRFEGRPLGEKVAEDSCVLVGKPLQDLRKIVFQGTREAVGETDLVTHEAPAICHRLCQSTHRDTLRGQRLEFLAVFEEQFEPEFRI